MAKGGTSKEIFRNMQLRSLMSYNKLISREKLDKLLENSYYKGLELFSKLKKSHNLRKSFVTMDRKFIRDNRKESKIFKLLAKNDFFDEDSLLRIYENSILISEETDKFFFDELEIYIMYLQIEISANIASSYKSIDKLQSDIKIAKEHLDEAKLKHEIKLREIFSKEKNEDSLVKSYVKFIKQIEDIPQNNVFCRYVGISESTFSNIFNSKTFVFKVNERLRKWEEAKNTNQKTKDIAKKCIIKLTNKFRDYQNKKDRSDAIKLWKTRSPNQGQYKDNSSFED